MRQTEVTGKTVTEAVDNACAQLGVSIADIEWEVLEEPKKGLFGIGSKPARVRITVTGSDEEETAVPAYKKPERKPEKKTEKPAEKPAEKAVKKPEKPKEEKSAPKPVIHTEEVKEEISKPAEPVKAAEENTVIKAEETESVQEEPVLSETESARAALTDEDKAKIIGVAESFLNEIFAQMNMPVEISSHFSDNKHIFIEMKGDDMGTIIGKRGQTLDSIQYLTNLVVNKGDYPYMNITLDTEDYRAKRQRTLEQLAYNLAKKATHSRKNITLEPMNPYERRIIHAALQNDRYVTTYSEGTEPYRYVVIALKNNYYSQKRNYR